MLDAVAQGPQTGGFAVIVGRRPSGLSRTHVEHERRIEYLARRGIAFVEGGRIDDRLERRTRLAHGLDSAVELALVEREPADHRVHAARIGIHGDDGAGNLGDLAQAELVRLALHGLHEDHVADVIAPSPPPAGPFHAIG